MLCYSSGNILTFINIQTQERTFFHGFRQGAIGAVAIHPSQPLIAIGEKNITNAQIYIIQYPEMKIKQVLKGAAHQSISALNFNQDGNRLASVAGEPDYMLTIWDWQQARLIQRSKAFSQDIYNVAFHPTLEGHLITSGVGHIKFWKLANTFTGLKLQGDIGKFGASELSDIWSFVYLPDGKLMSGSEQGCLLLWEGAVIKCEIGREKGQKCHDGAVDALLLADGKLYSGGDDGFVRIWDAEQLNSAEAKTSSSLYDRLFELKPLKEIQIGPDAKVKGLIKIQNQLLIQDGNGHLMIYDLEKKTCRTLFQFQSGGFLDADLNAHRLLTISGDGSLRLTDLFNSQTLYWEKLQSKPKLIQFLPESMNENGSAFAVGYFDGTIRVFRMSQVSDQVKISLMNAFKPHSKPIVSFAFSKDGKKFVSCAEDGVLFFFNVITDNNEQFTFEPVGFYALLQPIQKIHFNSDRLFIITKDGKMLQMKPPHQKQNQETFELIANEVEISQYKIEVKDDLIRAEQLGKETALSLLESAQKNEQPPPFDQTTEPWLIQLKKEGNLGGSFDVICFLFLTDDLFLCYIRGETPADSQVRLFSLSNKNQSRLIIKSKSEILYMRLSASGRYLMFTCADGSVCLKKWDFKAVMKSEPIGHEQFFSHFGQVQEFDNDLLWTEAVHEPGSKSFLLTTFDDFLLVSCSSDGGLFIYQNKNQVQKQAQPLPKVELKSIQDLPADAYNIQESKLKFEHDKELAAAQQKQKEMKSQIEELRQQFKETLKAWQQSPLYDSEKRWQLGINIGLKENMDLLLEENLLAVRKKLAWESEREQLGIQKIKSLYLDDILTDHFTLQSFDQQHKVSSFRTFKSDLQEKLVENAIQSKQLDNNNLTESFIKRKALLEEEQKSKNSKNKLEQRKFLRMERQKQLQQMIQQKPDDQYEDPNDLLQIQQAEQSIGDYKLKSSLSYVPTERDCLKPKKKLQQLQHLKNGLHQMKESFNKILIQLRNDKQECIEVIKKKLLFIDQLNEKLQLFTGSIVEKIPEPKMEKCAYPESRFLIEKQDLEKAALEEEQAKHQNDELTALSADYKKKPDVKAVEENKKQNQEVTNQIRLQEGYRLVHGKQIPLTDYEKKKYEEDWRRWQFEKRQLEKSIQKEKKQFDIKLLNLLKTRTLLETDLQMGQLKCQLLHKEWTLLKDDEKIDQELHDKLNKKLSERLEIHEKIRDCHQRMNSKREEVELIAKRLKEMYQQCKQSVGENIKHEEFLMKLYKRKLKRFRKKDEDDESDDQSDYDDLNYSSDEDFDLNFDETRPPTCPESVYNQVLALRERRLDQEAHLNTVQKMLDALKKENEHLVVKERHLDASVQSSEKEILDFQRMKLQKLNQLSVYVPLRPSQIALREHLTDDATPIEEAILFLNSEIKRLQMRSHELLNEKVEVVKQHKELKRQHYQFIKEKKEKEEKMKELERHLVEVQILKFGREVDLDKLERVGVNKVADELRSQVLKEEKEHQKETEEWDQQLTHTKQDYQEHLKENTLLLREMAQLKEQYLQIEESFDYNHKESHEELLIKNQKEIEQLQQKLASQTKKMEKLKSEIHQLSHKPHKPLTFMSKEISPRKKIPKILKTSSSEISEYSKPWVEGRQISQQQRPQSPKPNLFGHTPMQSVPPTPGSDIQESFNDD